MAEAPVPLGNESEEFETRSFEWQHTCRFRGQDHLSCQRSRIRYLGSKEHN